MKILTLAMLSTVALLDAGCLMGIRAARRAARPAPADPVFARLDANHDGAIDAAELAEASAALRSFDRNHDGRITSDEWPSR